MTHWIVPSNEGTFRLIDYMKSHDVVDWRQGRYTYSVGDIIYMYSSFPYQRITFKMVVERINVPSSEYLNGRDYWIDIEGCEEGLRQNKFVRFRLLAKAPQNAKLSFADLRNHGLRSSMQSSMMVFKKSDRELFYYLKRQFGDMDIVLIDNDSVSIDDADNLITEGAKSTVTVNRYERNSEARQKCIEANGCSCAVCGINFEDVYGSIGKGFIHVHHIVPISSIGEEYELDPVHDLVPVCPNCHAMLHKGSNGQVLTIEQLKEVIKDNRNKSADPQPEKASLVVKFGDGTIITGETNFQVYQKALIKIGLERVEPIAREKQYHRLHCALITRIPESNILTSWKYEYVEENGYYIVKGMKGKTMANMLNLISERLNLKLTAYVESKE